MKSVEQIPLTSPRFEQVFHRDHRDCTCELPMTSKKWNDALGTFVVIRLCCLAKVVQQLAYAIGLDTRELYEVFAFDPKWVWDCTELHQRAGELDGTTEVVERGPPPRWLRERMEAKGIEIRNLPQESQ